MRDQIERYWNKWYLYSIKLGLKNSYDYEMFNLKEIHIIDEDIKEFNIDENNLKSAIEKCKDLENGLTIKEAEELLKWTVNNTRNNLLSDENIKDLKHGLGGCCGFSQFSSLYPLQELGLKITINNMRDLGGPAHAYGTVTFPVETKEGIVNKQFLIDCTYNQFFDIAKCASDRYFQFDEANGFLKYRDPGYFMKEDTNKELFAKELLENGFVELTDDNLYNYAYGFIMSSTDGEKLARNRKELLDINRIKYILNNSQEEFDYTKEEFEDHGLNVSAYGNYKKR
jgi:hypothetical protein